MRSPWVKIEANRILNNVLSQWCLVMHDRLPSPAVALRLLANIVRALQAESKRGVVISALDMDDSGSMRLVPARCSLDASVTEGE